MQKKPAKSLAGLHLGSHDAVIWPSVSNMKNNDGPRMTQFLPHILMATGLFALVTTFGMGTRAGGFASILALFSIFAGAWLLYRQRTNGDFAMQNEAWFKVATESNLDAFLIFEAIRNESGTIEDFKCIFLNQRAIEILGASQEVFLGHLLFEKLPFFNLPSYREQLIEVVNRGTTFSFEIRPEQLEIQADWLLCKCLRLADGLAVTISDISRQKIAEGDLIQAERFQAAIIDSVSYGIIATDQTGNIITMNNAAHRMLWYDESDINHNFTLEMIHDAGEISARAEELSNELGRPIQAGFDVFTAKAKAGLADEREWTYVRKDGTRFPVKLSTTELRDEENQTYGYLCVAYDISEQKRSEEHIKHIALHDSLTGLPNRTLFNDRARNALEQARRKGENVAIAMMDVDHFKNINDTLGHHIGDILLQEVSSRLVRNVRVSDTIGRMGGDEFAFLLPNIDHPKGSALVLKKIIKALQPTVIANDHQLHVTASIGICVFPQDGDDLATLMRKADTAMYEAKKQGRNNYQIFNAEMEAQASQAMNLENELRTAIDKGSFELFYQPLVDIKNQQIAGVEALLRWERTPGKFTSPVEFVPLAEDSGLIVPIGEWVIRESCRQAAQIKAAIGRPLRVAINISPRQFRQKNLVSCILQALKDFDVSPDQIELEITESVLMVDLENSIVVLGLLRSLGVHVALDDFGTGYSSLSYLSRFPVDRIKMDQSFMRNVTHSKESASLAKIIVNMAKTLNIPVTAEGIETQEQLDFIAATGCDEAQGYHMGKPMPYDKLIKVCQKYN